MVSLSRSQKMHSFFFETCDRFRSTRKVLEELGLSAHPALDVVCTGSREAS